METGREEGSQYRGKLAGKREVSTGRNGQGIGKSVLMETGRKEASQY